ncbi:MAG: ABC transporter substrate-binding protein [Kiritimatiellae bacterium]|nr:ABC transporter substrate-binding protein [Kiritimatiellia bacterium]
MTKSLRSCLLATALTPALLSMAADPIVVGAIFAVTGPAGNLGLPEKRSAELLVEQVNAAGGVLGRPVKLIVKDSGSSPEKAVSFCKQLIEEDGVLAIIGPSTSGETMLIKPICEEEKVPLISCAAAEVIVNPLAKYVFKTPQKDSQAATLIFRTLKAQGLTRIGVTVDNTSFGQAGKAQLAALAPDMGITIAAAETYDKAATDLTDILAKIKAQNIQAVVNWSVVPAQSIVPRNMRMLGMTQPLFQSHGFGSLRYVEQAGEAAEGIVFPCGHLLVAGELPETHPQKKIIMSYKVPYETRFKEEANSFGGYAWDALAIALEGVRKANAVDRAKVRDAIEGLQGFAGVTGVFNYSPTDHGGLSLEAFEMLTVKGGKFTIYRPPAAPAQPQ